MMPDALRASAFKREADAPARVAMHVGRGAARAGAARGRGGRHKREGPPRCGAAPLRCDWLPGGLVALAGKHGDAAHNSPLHNAPGGALALDPLFNLILPGTAPEHHTVALHASVELSDGFTALTGCWKHGSILPL